MTPPFHSPSSPRRSPVGTGLVPFLCCLIALAAAVACAATPKTPEPEPRPLSDGAALSVIQRVERDTMAVRGLSLKGDLKVFILDSATLRHLIDADFEQSFPDRKRHAVERFLRSLRIIPDNVDLKEMFESLLDEQVGGLYDPETKRLYVREGYDIVGSGFARTVLSHEICHALQDAAYDLKKIGIDSPDNDDLAEAATTVTEGDATVEMGEYVMRFEPKGILEDLPKQSMMNQSALDKTPYFFRQMLLYPYIQGQVFVMKAIAKGPTWRNYLFTHPPTTTRQVIHPDRYFGHLDVPAPLALLTTQTAAARKVPGRAGVEPPLPPDPPRGYRRMEVNRLGELGIRLLLEERLGMGVAMLASEGWNGDAYLICEDPQGRSWFCLETAWDTPRDALEFLGAWVTLWQSIAGDPSIGDRLARNQDFTAGQWKVHVESAGNRLVSVWYN